MRLWGVPDSPCSLYWPPACMHSTCGCHFSAWDKVNLNTSLWSCHVLWLFQRQTLYAWLKKKLPKKFTWLFIFVFVYFLKKNLKIQYLGTTCSQQHGYPHKPSCHSCRLSWDFCLCDKIPWLKEKWEGRVIWLIHLSQSCTEGSQGRNSRQELKK